VRGGVSNGPYDVSHDFIEFKYGEYFAMVESIIIFWRLNELRKRWFSNNERKRQIFPPYKHMQVLFF